LRAAAEAVLRGEFEADLGRGFIKKRVAYRGGGKSGGARLLVARRAKNALIFVVGRDKSDPGSDFTSEQIEAAKQLAAAYAALDEEQLQRVIETGALKDIGDAEEDGNAID